MDTNSRGKKQLIKTDSHKSTDNSWKTTFFCFFLFWLGPATVTGTVSFCFQKETAAVPNNYFYPEKHSERDMNDLSLAMNKDLIHNLYYCPK